MRAHAVCPTTCRAPVRRPGAADRARGPGLRRSAPAGPRHGRAVRRLFDRVGLVQIDSVNVLQRAHYLPLFSRAGAYDIDAARPRRALRAAAAVRVLGPRGVADPGRAPAGAALADGARGRRRVGRDAADPARAAGARRRTCSRRCARAGRWPPARCSSTSGRSAPARGGTGATSSARSSGCSGAGRSRRRGGAGSSGSTTCPSACCRPAVLAAPTPPVEEAQRELLRVAARSLGVGDRARPARLLPAARAEAKLRVAELVEAGELWPVAVEGWRAPAYLRPGGARSRGG